LHLLLRDLTDLGGSNGARRFLARQLGAGLEIRRLLDEVGDRRRAGLEGEALVGENGDDNRCRLALLHFLRAGVERLAELHDVETALAERGTDRGRRGRRTGCYLQFQVAGNLLCHFRPFRAAANRPALSIRPPSRGLHLDAVVRNVPAAGGRPLLPRISVPRDGSGQISRSGRVIEPTTLPRPFRPDRIPARPASAGRKSTLRPSPAHAPRRLPAPRR